MNNKLPYTPFSTALSGSAKETELRLRNIFSGPKKRPPVLFLALMFSACLFCGNLVSCQVTEANEPAGSLPDASVPEALPVVPIDPANPPANETEKWLLQALFLSAYQDEPFQDPTARLLSYLQEGDSILGAALVTDHLENTLILGVMDQNTHELDGSAFRYSYPIGIPNVVTFRDFDGKACLLYTFNYMIMSQYTGEAGMVCLEDGTLCWKWPVEGDIRDSESALYQDYSNYWSKHLALLAPGGVDVYEVTPDFVFGQEDPWSMWQLSSNELFYADPSSAAELPMPIYFQALNWLVEETNDPGGWRIVSLERNEERSDEEHALDCFTLEACTDDGSETLVADLFFSYESEPSRPRAYLGLDHGEVYDSYTAYRTSPIDRDAPSSN